MHRLLILSLPLALLAACGDKGRGGGDDTGPGGDGGDAGDDGGDYEEGCITVDGEGGYAWINDAIAVADEGSTIQLCAASSHEEEVVVDKAVSIVGPGASSFLLVAPTNTTAVTITAAGASLSGIGIDSTRSGIAVDGAAGVSVSEVEVVAAGNWGLSAKDAPDLSVADSSFIGNGYGGLHFEGGAAELSGLTLQANLSYGIHATDDAVVTVTGSAIDSTAPADESDPTDGWGAYADGGAALVLSNNTFDNNFYAAVRAEEGDASLSGDTITNSALGVYLRLGEFAVEDVSIEGATVFGAFFVSLDPVVISGLRVSADPEGSASTPYDEWGTSDVGIPGTGVVAAADEVMVDGLEISGWNNCGLFLQPASSGDTGVATISDLEISNTGRYGVYSASMDATFVDSSISDTRVVDEEADRIDDSLGTDVLCYYVNYFAAVYNAEGTVDWQGGSISGSEGWGFSSIYGNLQMDGMTLDGNNCAGAIGYQGALSLTNSTVTGHTEGAAINSNSDSLVVLSGNTFSGNRLEGTYEQVYDYMDTSGYRITYTYADGYARVTDVVLFEVPESVISENTFENGDSGIAVYGGSATFSDNTWAGYRSWAINAIEYDTPADVELDGATVSNVGGAALGCRDSSMDLRDLTVTQGNHYQYSYDYLLEYSDGTTSTYSSSGTSPSIGLYGSDCNLYVDGAVFSELEGNAVELASYSGGTSSTELNDVTISTVGTESTYADSAVYAYSYGGDLSVYADGVHITDARSDHGVELYGSSSGTVLLDATDLSVNGAADNGLYAYASSATDSVTVDGDGVDIQNTTDDGIYAYQATVTLVNSSVAGSGGSGLSLSKSTATVSDTAFDGNTAWGMECSGGTEACSGVTHTSNTEGEQSGCDASCGLDPAAGGGDTGGDTGL